MIDRSGGKAPLASIVIPSYNYERYLPAAIESALNQTYPDAEVIVVDDGSVDNSRAIIESYGERIVSVFQENRGEAAAYNTGFRRSRGEVICFLDSDDALLPSAIEEAMALFLEPNVVKVQWPLWIVDQRGEKSGEIVPARPLPEGDLRESVIRGGPDSYVWPPTSGIAWTRSFLESVLPIPESDYRFGADAYLLALDVFFGLVKKLAEPRGLYRVHGRNHYFCRTFEERLDYELTMFDRRCVTLQEQCRSRGIEVDPSTWKPNAWSYGLQRAIQAICSLVPEGESFILVDHEGWGVTGESVAGRRRIPFLERDGKYWGPPPDDATAIRELERLRDSGATFIVFAWPAFWWLDYYTGFLKYLRSEFDCVLEDDRLLIFNLRP